jgi:hypothetical protein
MVLIFICCFVTLFNTNVCFKQYLGFSRPFWRVIFYCCIKLGVTILYNEIYYKNSASYLYFMLEKC